jgi:hypothetical protein
MPRPDLIPCIPCIETDTFCRLKLKEGRCSTMQILPLLLLLLLLVVYCAAPAKAAGLPLQASDETPS